MKTVDHFPISYVAPEISTFKESQHDATTTAPAKIVTLSGFHVFKCLFQGTFCLQSFIRLLHAINAL